jgi:hypothetical protein
MDSSTNEHELPQGSKFRELTFLQKGAKGTELGKRPSAIFQTVPEALENPALQAHANRVKI